MAFVILGAGGFGREVVDVFDAAASSDAFLGFLDDGSPDLHSLASIGAQLLGEVSDLADLDADYLVGVGSPEVRRGLDDQAQGLGAAARAPLIHGTAAIGRQVRLGPGSIVCAQAVITTNVVVGRHLHLNLGSTIGHDCVLGDYVTVAPGVNISGNVTVGDLVEFGTGSAVLPGLHIGAGAMVGAGAVVTKDVTPGTTVVGIPARPVPGSR